MEEDSFYKEEYDSTFKIVKKEEEGYLKIEENRTQSSLSNFCADQLTIPWNSTTIQSSFLLTSLQYPPTTIINPWGKQKYKPFLIIREPKASLCIKEFDSSDLKSSLIKVKVKPPKTQKTQKKTYSRRCKNYVGLLCAGISRTVLTAKANSKMSDFIFNRTNERKTKFETLKESDTTSLMEILMAYIYEGMCGKKVRKPGRERDFKIRNVTDLQSLLEVTDEDDDITCLNKGVLKDTVEYFFESDYYNLWLENGMMTAPNRYFFQINKKEIEKKFLNPGFYKPKFNKIKVKRENL